MELNITEENEKDRIKWERMERNRRERKGTQLNGIERELNRMDWNKMEREYNEMQWNES